MHPCLTIGQLSILHSLRDGDEPLLRVPESELIYFARDVAQLAHLGLIEVHGRTLALRLEGLEQIGLPGNSMPVSVDAYSRPEFLHRMFGPGHA